MLYAKLERHLARPHTLPYEVSAFIYILIDWLGNPNCLITKITLLPN